MHIHEALNHSLLTPQCMLNSVGGEVIARFAAPGYNTRNLSTQVAKLEIRPGAQFADICNHVMVSALIMERQRIVENARQYQV